MPIKTLYFDPNLIDGEPREFLQVKPSGYRTTKEMYPPYGIYWYPFYIDIYVDGVHVFDGYLDGYDVGDALIDNSIFNYSVNNPLIKAGSKVEVVYTLHEFSVPDAMEVPFSSKFTADADITENSFEFVFLFDDYDVVFGFFPTVNKAATLEFEEEEPTPPQPTISAIRQRASLTGVS